MQRWWLELSRVGWGGAWRRGWGGGKVWVGVVLGARFRPQANQLLQDSELLASPGARPAEVGKALGACLRLVIRGGREQEGEGGKRTGRGREGREGDLCCSLQGTWSCWGICLRLQHPPRPHLLGPFPKSVALKKARLLMGGILKPPGSPGNWEHTG